MSLQTSVVPNALGAIGTALGCMILIPQIWHDYRMKRTGGRPSAVLLLGAASAIPSGVYAITKQFCVALVVQPQCISFLRLIAWAQYLVYESDWLRREATAMVLGLVLIFAGAELGLAYVMKVLYTQGITWPLMVFGVAAWGLDLVQFITVPLELLKERGRVIGINFFFLGIDWCGAFFSLMAIATQYQFDILFGVYYSLFCLFEVGLVISHMIWMLRTREIRQRARNAGQRYDEFDEATEWQSKGFDLQRMFSNRHHDASLDEKMDESGVERVAC